MFLFHCGNAVSMTALTRFLAACTQNTIALSFRHASDPEQISDDQLCSLASFSPEGYLGDVEARGLLTDFDRSAMLSDSLRLGISRCATTYVLAKPPTGERLLPDGSLELTYGGRLDLNVVYRPRHTVRLVEGLVVEFD